MAMNKKTGMVAAQLRQRTTKRRWIAWGLWVVVIGIIVLLGGVLNDYQGGFWELPFADVVNVAVDWVIDTMGPIFNVVKVVTQVILNNLVAFFTWLPWWSTVILITLAAWRLASWRIALFAAFGMYSIGMFGLWELAMETLALVITSVFIATGAGIPLGILCALSDRIWNVMRPILDAMQTMPAFVYLIPAVMLFGIGRVPGTMATVIYALPPAVRLTNLGIRQVPSDLVEAGKAFGSTRTQLLMKIQLPLAMPTIMAGVNQAILLALSLSVLASMIAAGGLGREVLMSLGQVDAGRGFIAGLSIVLLAMIIDRISQSMGGRSDRTRIMQP